jgi:predicted amidohydrolase YtcJ
LGKDERILNYGAVSSGDRPMDEADALYTSGGLTIAIGSFEAVKLFDVFDAE